MELTTTNETDSRVDYILAKAKKSKSKGRLYEYERYKTELQYLGLGHYEYEQACRELARILRV